jgi:hypothetical protein
MLASTLFKRLVYETSVSDVDPYAPPEENPLARSDRVVQRSDLHQPMVEARYERAIQLIVNKLKSTHSDIRGWDIVIKTSQTQHHSYSYTPLTDEHSVIIDVLKDPDLKQLLPTLKRYAFSQEQRERIRDAVNMAKLEAKRYMRSEADKQASQETTPVAQIPAKDVPQKIVLPKGSTKGIDNPYWSKPINRYAGAPSGAPLHASQRLLLHTINSVLKKHGIPLLSVAYVGHHKDGTYHLSNFIIKNSNDSVIWRKYDMGGGSGQNWVYLNGEKYNTTTLTSATLSQQETLLRKTGLIK